MRSRTHETTSKPQHEAASSFGVQLAVACVRCYQAMLRPFLHGSCRYIPTCSEYAIESFRKHGLLRGLLLTLSRVSRCHPFASGGIDPVPEADPQASLADSTTTEKQNNQPPLPKDEAATPEDSDSKPV